NGVRVMRVEARDRHGFATWLAVDQDGRFAAVELGFEVHHDGLLPGPKTVGEATAAAAANLDLHRHRIRHGFRRRSNPGADFELRIERSGPQDREDGDATGEALGPY